MQFALKRTYNFKICSTANEKLLQIKASYTLDWGANMPWNMRTMIRGLIMGEAGT